MELDDDDKMIRSPSSEGKMVIKLKIPKLAPETMEVEKPPEEVIGILSDSLKPAKEGKKICLECRKEFSSGKALGGHMRVHVNQSANKNPNFLKPSKTTKVKKTHQDHNNGDDVQSKPYYMNCVNDEGKPTCSQCGKTFPSMKSLFGHMRCHPERVWRGILPPPNTSILTGRSSGSGGNKIQNQNSSGSGSSYSSEKELGMSEYRGDQVVDLTKFLRGWSVTDRRGRRAVLKAADGDFEEGLMEAVEDLMSLANGGGGSMAESGVTQPLFKVELTEGSNSNSLSNKEHEIDPNSPSSNFRVTGKGKAVMEDEIKLEQEDGVMNHTFKIFSEFEFDGRNNIKEQFLINYKDKKDHNKIKKPKKMKLMMELEPNDVVNGSLTAIPSVPDQQHTECKYKCTTCNKCFTSHQALGGHRSSHNKPKITSTDRVEEAADYKSFLMNLSGENLEKEVAFGGGFMIVPANGCSTNTISNSTSIGNIHQCKICDKIFATGQALGGHQRCHWTGPTGAQAPSSQITYTGEAANQMAVRKVLDFDLNEVPPAMLEEYEGGNNGYASSSYNFSNMC